MKNRFNFKTNRLFACTIIIAGFGFVSCNNTPKTPDTKETAEEHNEAKFDEKKSEKDAQFLVESAEINLEEMQLGKLAQSRSKNADVIALGKMMENEHANAMNDLKDLAAKKQISIPTSITQDGQDAFDKLNEKTGKDFDKSYCEMMVKGHKKAIDKFESASKDVEDADIRAWATNMLPALRTHLDHAITCEEKCKNL